MFRQKVEPGLKMEYVMIPGFGIKGKIGFRKFVEFLFFHQGSRADRHFDLQKNHLFWNLDDYDFIGRLETFEQDFIKLMLIINFPMSDKVYAMIQNKNNSHHVTNSQMYLHEYYDEEIYRMVTKVYYEDFLMFDYRMNMDMVD